MEILVTARYYVFLQEDGEKAFSSSVLVVLRSDDLIFISLG